MPITTKTAAALLVIFLALFGCAWLILNEAVRPGFERLEEQFHERDKLRVEANLAAIAAGLQSRTLDYSMWDDAYAYIGGGNPTFPSENFDQAWFESYGIDLLAFADDEGRLLWTSATFGGTMRPDPATASRIIGDHRAHPAAHEPPAGIIWTAHGPLIIAVAHALPSSGIGAPRGYVIMGRRLSQNVLSEQVQLDLRLIPASAPPAALADRMRALATSNSQTWITEDSIQSLIALRDVRGALAGAVLAERPRDISALGARSIAIALILFTVASALGLVALGLMLRRMVIARIERLEQHLHAQSNAVELAPFVAPPSRDEVGRLTDAYNALTERLRLSNARERHANFERETAAAANRMKSDFLANVSHELRTPLTAVIGYSELVEEDLAGRGFDGATEDLHRIQEAARRVLSLISEINDLSKIEAGRMEIRPSSFKVEEMLRGVQELTTPMIADTGNTLTLNISADLGDAYSDEIRLRQSLINLLSSACKFTRNGAIVLTAHRLRDQGQEMLCFVLQDSGISLSDAQLNGLFEPFSQADGAIARRFGGTGLGLSITREIVELMGGRLEARSGEGEGSTLTMIVPATAIDRGLRTPNRNAAEAA